MANSFLALPAPVGNGSGAAVNVSAMGGTKTIVVGGNLRGIVSIEVATDTAGTLFQAIKSFQGVGECTLDVAAMWMRITVIGFKGGAPVVAVGANTDGTSNAQLNVTAGSGTGAAVDISALPGLKTLVVPGGFTGLLVLELSEDNVAFEPVVTSQSGGAITFLSYGKFARIVRVGVNGGTTPEIWIAGSSQGANVGSSPSGTPGDVPFFDPATGALTSDSLVVRTQDDGVGTRALAVNGLDVGSYAIFSGSLFLGGPYILHNSVTPGALINGTTNDWGNAGEFGPAPFTFSRLRALSAGAALLTGILASAVAWPYNGGNLDGLFLFFQFIGAANTVTLKHENAGSAAANRFSLPGGADIVLQPKGCVLLMYDNSLQRWIKGS